MRIIIVGGSGYVGQYLCQGLPQLLVNCEFYSTYFTKNPFKKYQAKFPNIRESYFLDLSKDENDAIKIIDKVKPDIIINTSAMSTIQQCQNYKETSFHVNDPHKWAEYALKNGCKKFIHFSTDMVYDGFKGNYNEEEANPLSNLIYGLSKRNGEINLLKLDNIVILRSALVIGKKNITGEGRGSTLDWMTDTIMKATKEKPAGFYENEFRTPILVNDIVRVVAKIIEINVSLPKKLVLNLGGPTKCNRYQLGLKIAKRIGVSEDVIKPTLQEGNDRPSDISMECKKLDEILNIKLCTLYESLDFINDINK